MLKCCLTVAAMVGAFAVATVGSAVKSWAGVYSPGGGCTASGVTIGCTATLPGGPGDSGAGGTPTWTPGSGSTSGSGGGPSPTECTSAPVSGMGPGPGGQTDGQWYFVTCTSTLNGALGGGSYTVTETWIPAGQQPAPPPPPPNPATVGAQAASQLTLSSPTIVHNPAAWGVVNFLEWLWVDPSMWHAVMTSATACNAGGCVTAQATATPVSVAWQTGDGGGTTCDGPGNVYDPARPDRDQSTYCSYTFTRSSRNQPTPDGNPNDASFTLVATVRWTVSWSAWGAASGGGSLADMSTSASAPLRVEQIEAVNAP